MICLFCNNNSDSSKSVEHIIPESLGNLEYILPKGIVCDKCNNYFGSKLEKELLEQPYFRSVRHRREIESKKKNVPGVQGFLLQPFLSPIEIQRNNGERSISISSEKDISKLVNCKKGVFVIPKIDEPSAKNIILSRFLAKVAVEALIYKVLNSFELIEEIAYKAEFIKIKEYARYGSGTSFWPYHYRRVYSEDKTFIDLNFSQQPNEVLHEFSFLFTKEEELYFVIIIMGIEYAINLGEPTIDTYISWLSENKNKSFLME